MDFDQVFNRKETKSLKWDHIRTVFGHEDLLPMWVADMDFQAPPEVNQALLERIHHGIYGYTIIDDAVKEAIQSWNMRRHGFHIEKNWLSFSPGVVISLRIAIEALTDKDDKILIQTPVYTPFSQIIRNTDRQAIENPLQLEDGRYEIDFDHFERQLQKGVRAFLLCSPHNPVGRVWTKDELMKMANLCLQYNVIMLSDEIHCDLIYPNYTHIPLASLGEKISQQTVTFMSATKTFNLAGLQSSYIITQNETWKRKIDHLLNIQGLSSLNTMGITSLEAAYTYGEKWLKQLLKRLTNYKDYVTEKLHSNTPLKVIEPEGTYLLWIDCCDLGLDDRTLQKFFVQQAKVGLSAGIQYGKEGTQFMRMNIACPFPTLKEGTERIITAIQHSH